jgi:hypothetical protein
MAVAILAQNGYSNCSFRKKISSQLLESLGYTIISRENPDDKGGRPLLRPQWAGAIDLVEQYLSYCGRNGVLFAASRITKLETTVYLLF